MTKPLKPYWIRAGLGLVWLIPDIDDRYDRNAFFKLEPIKFKWEYPGACLFSRLENKHGYVKCWLYNFKTSSSFKDPKDRDYFLYWIDPSVLVPINMED